MRLILATLALAACDVGAHVGSERSAVVYGDDDRTEVYAHPSAVHRAIAANAIGVQIHESWIDEAASGDVEITYERTLGEAKDLCAGERFAHQIEPGTCSGTLIDSQHLMTAGHCMATAEDCAEYVWVLGFRYASDGVLAALDADDVYRCDEVIAYFDDEVVDHAFVRLDRPVVGHTPAPVRAEAPLANGTPLVMIGHPNGIPMKIDSGGIVTSSFNGGFTATVDAFAGNSGSGVFDAEGRVVGILRAGDDDYVGAGGCNRVLVIDPPPADDGDELTYVAPAIDAFCETGVASPVCGSAPLPGDTCASAETIDADTQTIAGTLDFYSANEEGSCGGDGAERAFTFTLDAPALLRAELSGFDTVLYLREGCAAEVACNDDISDDDRGSSIEAELDPGTYVIFVDAYDGDDAAFNLELTFEPIGGPDSDAGMTGDADGGMTPIEADGGMTPPEEEGGCGCSAPRRSSAPWWIAMIAALVIGRWRPVSRRRAA
jgi:MYXO-CTERM domain-containing protein